MKAIRFHGFGWQRVCGHEVLPPSYSLTYLWVIKPGQTHELSHPHRRFFPQLCDKAKSRY